MTPLEKEIKNRAISHIGILSYFSFYLKNLFLQKSITNKKAYVPPACPNLFLQKSITNKKAYVPPACPKHSNILNYLKIHIVSSLFMS